MNRILNNHTFGYLKIHICSALNESDGRADVRALVVTALTHLHGQVGAKLSIDILQWLPSHSIALLRIPHSDTAKVWSALTLLGEFREQPCCVQVLQASTSLCSLAMDHCVSPRGILLDTNS